MISRLREEPGLWTFGSPLTRSQTGDGNTFCTCTEQGRAVFNATLNRKGSPQKRLSAKILEVIQSQRDGTLGDNLTEGGSTAERFSLTLACNSVQWFTASVAILAS
jgi:hypothetical protein